ncbi:oxidoreductase [Gluconobacter frateurii M-2]|nr:oxidoreductase [Gluconobacter frateurii M-2]
MDVILGGTGHVGRAVLKTVLAAGHDVTVVSRRASSASGGEFSTVALDVTDTSALSALFQKARRMFALNPPAAVSGNTDIEVEQFALS